MRIPQMNLSDLGSKGMSLWTQKRDFVIHAKTQKEFDKYRVTHRRHLVIMYI